MTDHAGDHPPKVAFANTLRGVAALCVLISHYLGVFWADPALVAALINAPPLYILQPPFWWVHPPGMNWGALGVALFFLVSGFVIPFSFRRSNALTFLVGRFFRIWPVYAVGFSISLLSILIVGTHFGAQWPFRWPEVIVHYFPGLRELLWSRQIDGIIWTLDVEVKFYLACACIAGPLQRSSTTAFVVPLLIVVMAVFLLAAGVGDWPSTGSLAYRVTMGLLHAAPYLVFMFVGVTFHYVHTRSIRVRTAAAMIAVLLISASALMLSGPFASEFGLAANYAAAVLIFAVSLRFPDLLRPRMATDFLARISYPLYAVHGIAGYAVLRLLLETGVPHWVAVVAATSGAFALAWLVHIAVERPSHRAATSLSRAGFAKRQAALKVN